MAQSSGIPNQIQNGQVPDGNKLMTNLNFLHDKLYIGTTTPVITGTVYTYPSNGFIWIDISDLANIKIKIRNGGTWQEFGYFIKSATAPTSPDEGDVWIDTSESGNPIMKIYTGSEWLAVGGSL
jgi:hypothetical protein